MAPKKAATNKTTKKAASTKAVPKRRKDPMDKFKNLHTPSRKLKPGQKVRK